MGILIAIIGFGLACLIMFIVPSFISKITGFGIKIKNGGTYHPEDFDNLAKATKKVVKKGAENFNSNLNNLSKSIKGSYKYHYDNITQIKLTQIQDDKSLLKYIELNKKIQRLECTIENEHKKNNLPESFKRNHPYTFDLNQAIKKIRVFGPWVAKLIVKNGQNYCSVRI